MNLATEEREEDVVRPASATTRLGGTDIFRGALVIITAIVIGGFVVSRGLDRPVDTDTSGTEEAADPAAPAEGEGETDAAGDDVLEDAADDVAVDQETTVTTAGIAAAPDTTVATTEAPVEETVPAAAARTPAEVKVLVLNGAQTQGIAARGTEALKAASYNTAAPKNANTQQASAVLYTEGYELDAAAVAAVFAAGLETLVAPLDPTNVPIDDMQGSNVIVIIGNDDLIPVP